MLAQSAIQILKAVIMIICLILIGSIVSYFVQGEYQCCALLKEGIINFNGILVGGFGYGLMFFIISQGKSLLNRLMNIIQPETETSINILIQFEKLISWRRITLYSIPIYIAGSILLWKCGYPLQGFSKFYLAFFSMSIYFVASFILFFYLSVILFFMKIDLSSQKYRIKDSLIPMDLNSFNMFFIISSGIGILAIYFGFRGTLSANFIHVTGILKKMLILPIILYLPVTLVYSFYPRYVLRKINEHTIINKIKEINLKYSSYFIKEGKISLKEKLEFEKNLMELREKVYSEIKQFPVISLKDSFSVLMIILIFIQFILNEDPIIKDFFNFF